jgi:hypothetical protein
MVLSDQKKWLKNGLVYSLPNHSERSIVGLDVMNEYIDSTVVRIPVCLLCSLPVTIRGLVGPFRL